MTAYGQPAKLSFDVADVQIAKDATQGPSGDFLPGGRVQLRNVTMKQMITAAYKLQQDMVEEGPAWLDSDRFDIVAKADPKSSIDTLRLMLQTLLAERFKLAVHPDKKVAPVYALVMGKGGPKLTQSASGDAAKKDCQRHGTPAGSIEMACTGLTMADLAERLPDAAPAYVDLPVVDLTGLKGAYDLKLSWTGRAALEGKKKDDDGNPIPPAGGLSMFDALQAQLGLKLESRKYPMPAIVVDHVERTPTDN